MSPLLRIASSVLCFSERLAFSPQSLWSASGALVRETNGKSLGPLAYASVGASCSLCMLSGLSVMLLKEVLRGDPWFQIWPQ